MVSESAEARRHYHHRRHYRHRSARHTLPPLEGSCPDGGPMKRMSTTVYYTPILTPARQCPLALVHKSGRLICNAGRIKFEVQTMEGAGVVVDRSGNLKSVLKHGGTNKVAGVPKGMSVEGPERCQVGYGVLNPKTGKSTCLNPFKSVACDRAHNVGDVIFVPSAVGIRYPTAPGQTDPSQYATHDGYFYCADVGSAIRGQSRFDFFTALISDYGQANPFTKYSKSSNYGYCSVPASSANAQRVLSENKVNDPDGQLPAEIAAAYSNPIHLASAIDPNYRPRVQTVDLSESTQ